MKLTLYIFENMWMSEFQDFKPDEADTQCFLYSVHENVKKVPGFVWGKESQEGILHVQDDIGYPLAFFGEYEVWIKESHSLIEYPDIIQADALGFIKHGVQEIIGCTGWVLFGHLPGYGGAFVSPYTIENYDQIPFRCCPGDGLKGVCQGLDGFSGGARDQVPLDGDADPME
jgi:hypothetical protein